MARKKKWPAALVAAALCCGSALARPPAGGNDPPNVLIVILDDVGIDQLQAYDDLNHYPASDPYEYAATPNLDALAQAGVRFTQARANPICSPTRALINCGRYGFRNGTGSIVRPEDASALYREFSIVPAPDERILPEHPVFSDWDMAWFGKWHLGLEPEDGGSGDLHPGRIGWPEFMAAMRNLNQEPNPGHILINGQPVNPGYNHWYRVVNGQRSTETTYATVQQRLDCEEWILEEAAEPWCAVLAFSACHSPYDWPPDGLHTFPDLWPAGNGDIWDTYRAMLETVDHELGELLFNLGPMLDRTVVLVIGDNGTPDTVLQGARLAGQDIGVYNQLVDLGRLKGSPYEMGVRVPLVVSGPVVREPGRSSETLVDAVDLYATAVHLARYGEPLAGTGLSFEDSRSFVRALAAPHGHGHRNFCFSERFDPNGMPGAPDSAERCYVAPFQGHRFKLVRRPGVADEVYDLTDDPLELNDLGSSHPAHAHLAARLRKLLAS